MPEKPRRIFRVGELGVGRRPAKIIALAFRRRNRPHVRFVGVDLWEEFGLSELGKKVREQLNNLELRPKTDAVDFLSKEAPASFSHLYNHFLMRYLPHDRRVRLIREAHKVLRPGGRFVLVEAAPFHQYLLTELKAAGFSVSVRRLTSKELRKLQTFAAEQHAEDNEAFHRATQNASKKEREEDTRRSEQAFVKHIRRIEGKNSSRETREALPALLRGVSQLKSARPFVVLTAKKPRPTKQKA